MLNSSEKYQAAVIGSPRRSRILAVVDIISPDAVMCPPTVSSNAPWSKPNELTDHNFSAPARYATLEPGRWVLDGSVDVFPSDYEVPEHMGCAGNVLCGEDGLFDPPQWVELPFIGVDVLQALSVFFSSDPVDGVAEDFTVEVLSNGTVYHTETFTGNRRSTVAVDGFTVYLPTSIRVTVTKWSLPRRRIRISELLPGIYEEWTEDMLSYFYAVLQGDFSCLSFPHGSVDLGMDNSSRRFEPRRKVSLFQSIEERQGIEIHLGIDLLPYAGTEYKGLVVHQVRN